MKKTKAAAMMMCGALSTGVGCTEMDGAGDEQLADTEQAVTATTTTQSLVTAMASQEADLGGFDIFGVEPTTVTIFDLKVRAKVRWTADVTTDITWDADKVRQGQQLEISRKVSSAPGAMAIEWVIYGKITVAGGIEIDVPEIPFGNTDGACAPTFDEDADLYECTAQSEGIDVLDTPGIPLSPYVKLSMGVKFTINPVNGVSERAFLLGDEEILPSTQLDLTTGSLEETAAMPCDRPAGTGMLYILDPISYTPTSVNAVQKPRIAIGVRDPVIGAVQLPAIWEDTWGSPILSKPNLALSGAGDAIELGELQANNVLPTIGALGPFSGQEGAAVSFGASVQSACPITSYVWQFSDGTQSYGPNPMRAFGDDGQFDGQLTVKDATNLSATGSFGVSIANKAPVANAGPDTSDMWGKSINLQGQAVDPGSIDQSTLVYSWDFGDGTPGIGGANVHHVYTQPGDYVATFKACDDHVCSTDTVTVHVRKRLTQIAYTGSNTGAYSGSTNLMASLSDELGKPVPGASVAFVLAGVAMGSAQTSVMGAASKSVDITNVAGSYQVGAGYAGSSLYEASQTAEQFEVARMGSSIAYTGSLNGAPNKIVNLSAKLVDAQNRPLAGKLVAFKLGTQNVSATTDASGIASAPLKLSQKAGQYQLTATWAPAAGDDAKWTGSSSAVTFKLQSK